MIGIILTFLVAILGLTLLLLFCVRHAGTAEKQPTDNRASLPGLSAVFLPPFDVLLGADDYSALCTRPELESVRKKFWRDRRRIVLMWLAELRTDVHILWEFRRFLVRNGLQVTFREEAGVVFVALLALLYLSIVRVGVLCFGPFALAGALSDAKLLAEQLSGRGAALLSRVPGPRKSEIERGWVQQLSILGSRPG